MHAVGHSSEAADDDDADGPDTQKFKNILEASFGFDTSVGTDRVACVRVES